MNKHLISLNDLPPDGKEFTLDDQEIWEEPIKEFKMEYDITTPLRMKIFIQPVDEGILLKGTLSGAVAIPCNRCAEQADVSIDSKIEEYEEIPPETRHEKDHEQSALITFNNHAPMFSLSDFAWEQFLLAMPTNPLCRDDCKGICPDCGANLNVAACDCSRNQTDPRMAALANVKIAKKQ